MKFYLLDVTDIIIICYRVGAMKGAETPNYCYEMGSHTFLDPLLETET